MIYWATLIATTLQTVPEGQLTLPPVCPGIEQNVSLPAIPTFYAKDVTDPLIGWTFEVPGKGPRMTPLYQSYGNWLESHPSASVKEKCVEANQLMHHYFGSYDTRAASLAIQEYNLSEAITKMNHGLQAEFPHELLNAANWYHGNEEMRSSVLTTGELSVSLTAAPWLSTSEKDRTAAHFSSLSRRYHSSVGDEPYHSMIQERLVQLDFQLLSQQADYYLDQAAIHFPEITPQDANRRAKIAARVLEQFDTNLTLIDSLKDAKLDVLIERGKIDKPSFANVEEFACDQSVCAEFASISSALLTFAHVQHMLTFGDGHLYIIIPQERAILESTADTEKSGCWKKITGVCGPESYDRFDAPRLTLNTSDERNSPYVVEGFAGAREHCGEATAPVITPEAYPEALRELYQALRSETSLIVNR